MSEQQKKYDSTVARIAGNILSGTNSRRVFASDLGEQDRLDVAWAVKMARAIVAEVVRTTPEGSPR